MCLAGDVAFCCDSPVNILFHSLKIFLTNKLLFSSIFILTTIPLSSLFFILSLSTRPLRYEIYHLEALALVAPTRCEARHIWRESHEDAVSLLRIKALFALPCYLLSLLAAITAVHSTVFTYNGKTPTLHSAVTAVKQNWKRLFVTTIFVYAILWAFAPLPRTFAALTTSPNTRFLALAIGSAIEVYLMAVLSLGLVVSIAEDRFGWDAIKFGSALMEGRRVCGCALSGLFVLTSGMIGWKMELLMDSHNSSTQPLSPMATVGLEDKMGLICLYGLAVLWSYVITTVFYCDSRRRHGIRGPEPQPQDEGILL